MVAADGSGAQGLGLSKGLVVQELGWDGGTDVTTCAAIEDIIDAGDARRGRRRVIDVVLLWWREDDGDLTDALIGRSGRRSPTTVPCGCFLPEDGPAVAMWGPAGSAGGCDNRADADQRHQLGGLDRRAGWSSPVRAARADDGKPHRGRRPCAGFHAVRPEQPAGEPRRTSSQTAASCWCSSRWRSPATAGRIGPYPRPPARVRQRCATTVAISVGPPPAQRCGPSAQGFLFPLLSDFWRMARSPSGLACSVGGTAMPCAARCSSTATARCCSPMSPGRRSAR